MEAGPAADWGKEVRRGLCRRVRVLTGQAVARLERLGAEVLGSTDLMENALFERFVGQEYGGPGRPVMALSKAPWWAGQRLYPWGCLSCVPVAWSLLCSLRYFC